MIKNPMDNMVKNRQWAIRNNETWALPPQYCRLCKGPLIKLKYWPPISGLWASYE